MHLTSPTDSALCVARKGQGAGEALCHTYAHTNPGLCEEGWEN